MPMCTRCTTKCIFKSTGAAAKRHVSRVLGNLVNRSGHTVKGSGLMNRSGTSVSEPSSLDSSMSHTNSFFNQLLADESDDDAEEEFNDTESSDDTASSISDLDIRKETQWYYEVKMFDQTRCSECVGYIVNSGLKMDFEDHVVFVVQLPLPNVDVVISMCKKSEQRKHTFRVPFTVSLFDIMDAEQGVDAKSDNGSMSINYRLICLDDRPRVMKIQHKLDLEEPRPVISQLSIPENDGFEEIAVENSDQSSSVTRRMSSGEDLAEFERDPETLVGKLHVFLDEIDLPQLKSNVHDCFCILKCQHHWAMTSVKSVDQHLSWRWLLKLPVYDPATVVSLTAFGATGRLGQSTRLGKLRIRLSTLQPGSSYDSWLPFMSDGVEIGRVKLVVKVTYPSEVDLMKGYVKSVYQKEIYDYGLASGMAKSQIRKEHRKLIIQWLDTSEPRISKTVSRHVLDLEKESFNRKRFAMHIRRIQHVFAFMPQVVKKIRLLQSWENCCESTAVCIGVWIAGWNVTSAVVLGLCLLFWMISLQYNVPIAPPSMADPILMPPTSESANQNADRSVEHSNPYVALKSRYDQIQTTLVKIQKILDSIASFCERLHALCSWRDPVATRLLTIGLLAALFVLSVMGVRFCVCFAVCWFLRPPLLRTTLPPPPLNFFKRLPSKSDQIL